ncbi:hypothetical protein HanIR_Chr14g0688421 [Helianthus annuus]|nr:hypothetical protein HanIR_Chr14g0688421 [Helianthus annuus]
MGILKLEGLMIHVRVRLGERERESRCSGWGGDGDGDRCGGWWRPEKLERERAREIILAWISEMMENDEINDDSSVF